LAKFQALILLACVGGSVCAQGTSPQVATRSFDVAASAPQVCAIAAARLGESARINIRALVGDALTIDRLSDPATLSSEAASVEVRFPAFCNYPHLITVESESNGLWHVGTGAAPIGFANGVPYRATMKWGARSEEVFADASNQSRRAKVIPMAGGEAGDLVLALDITRGAANLRTNAPLLAGRYGDTIRIIVGPQ
jgi:hypothetical protein